jgi:hypothetical protein
MCYTNHESCRQEMIYLKFMKSNIKDKDIEYMTINTNYLYKLKDLLKLMTRNKLDEMCKVLKVRGTTQLEKEELMETLESYIKANIKSIITRLTNDEYNLLQNLLKNHGEVDYEDSLLNTTLYLNKLGMVFLRRESGQNMKIFIPLDIYEQSYYYTFNSLIFKSIKLNEKVNKALDYILYNYGIMDTENLYSMFNLLFDEKVDKLDFMNILNENLFKIKDLKFYDGYWQHTEVIDFPKKIAMQNIGVKGFYVK